MEFYTFLGFMTMMVDVFCSFLYSSFPILFLSLSPSLSLSRSSASASSLSHLMAGSWPRDLLPTRQDGDIRASKNSNYFNQFSRIYFWHLFFIKHIILSHLVHHFTSKKMNCPTLLPSPRWWLLVSARISFLVICKLNSTDSISVTPRF